MNLIPRRLRRPWVTTRTTYHEDNSKIEVVSMPAIVTAWPRWYEHPIRWWKMRHFRADVVYYDEIEEGVTSLVREEFQKREEDWFLNGNGGM